MMRRALKKKIFDGESVVKTLLSEDLIGLLDIEKITLHEGQQLKWFTEFEARNTTLAYGFNEIVGDFFKKAPFV